MATTPDLRPVLDFLDGLSRHNEKAWFKANRSAYEAARERFERFVDGLIEEFRETDGLEDLSAERCIARIYRDVRFSKDKSPYKTNLAAMVAPGGWKATRLGYYVSLGPDSQSLVGGGLHEPTSEQLDRFRRAIAEDPDEFKRITRAKAFVEVFGGVEGERLKTAPRGWDKAHPEIESLRLKQVLAVRTYADREVMSPDFPRRVAAACWAMKPFLAYLEDVCGPIAFRARG